MNKPASINIGVGTVIQLQVVPLQRAQYGAHSEDERWDFRRAVGIIRIILLSLVVGVLSKYYTFHVFWVMAETRTNMVKCEFRKIEDHQLRSLDLRANNDAERVAAFRWDWGDWEGIIKERDVDNVEAILLCCFFSHISRISLAPYPFHIRNCCYLFQKEKVPSMLNRTKLR